MEDLFKKFVNAGVGYIAQGNKRVQATIDKLVKDSKITEQEGKKIVDELLKSGDTKRAELEKQFQGLTERLKGRVGLGEKTAKAPAKPAAAKAADTAKKPAGKASGAVKAATAKAPAAKKPAAKKPAAAPAENPADNG